MPAPRAAPWLRNASLASRMAAFSSRMGPRPTRRMRHEPLQRIAEIARIVGGEAPLRAGLQDPRHLIEHFALDEAALVVTRLRPGVGEENEEPSDARVGQRGDDIAGIVFVEPDVRKLFFVEPAKKFRSACDVWFSSEEPDRRMGGGLPDKMLARAIDRKST